MLNCDPRGSLGYGEAFGRAVVGDWGGVDLADVLALTDAAAAAPGIDADRLAITGVSYGGYMTLWAISQDDRFRAAVSENGISDLFAAFGTSEDAGLWWLAEMAHAPWEQPMDWVDRSAVRYADRITTPLLHAPRGARSERQHHPERADVRGAPGAGQAGGIRARAR